MTLSITMESKTGLFAMSGDPIHFGHIEVIRQAKLEVDKLYVLINDNDEKAGKYLFQLHERVELAKKALQDFDGVEVITPLVPSPPESKTKVYNRVLADIYARYGCDILFRGIRNDADARYEESQMRIHQTIHPMNVKHIVVNDGVFSIISSSLVKSLVQHHLDTSQYVPIFIKRKLEEKIHKIFKIGLTGQMSTGKSWVGKKMQMHYTFSRKWNDYPRTAYGPVLHYINMDEFIRNIYTSTEPGCVKVTNQVIGICAKAGVDVTTDNKLDRVKLGQFFFTAGDLFKHEIEIACKPIINVMYRDALNAIPHHPYGTIVIIEWAQLIEMNMGSWVNNNVIVVDSPDREKLAESRGLSPSVLNERSKNQLSAKEKIERLRSAAKGTENIFEFSNMFHEPGAKYSIVIPESIKTLYADILKFFRGV